MVAFPTSNIFPFIDKKTISDVSYIYIHTYSIFDTWIFTVSIQYSLSTKCSTFSWNFYLTSQLKVEIFKGTVVWDDFCAHSIISCEFWRFGPKFAEIHVDSIVYQSSYSPYVAKKLLAYSPNMFIFFKLILHARWNTFCVF